MEKGAAVMVRVDIFSSREEYDIIVIDTEQYLTGTLFDYIVENLKQRVSYDIGMLWFWDSKEENVKSCLGYKGIAIKLFRRLMDRKAAKGEIKRLTEEALEAALH